MNAIPKQTADGVTLLGCSSAEMLKGMALVAQCESNLNVANDGSVEATLVVPFPPHMAGDFVVNLTAPTGRAYRLINANPEME